MTNSEHGELLTSKLFRFLVGPERKEFVVHSLPFSRLSRALDTLINGEMSEACEGTAVWDDMDPDTFVRFSEFAHSGDYTTPKIELRTEPHEHTRDQMSPKAEKPLQRDADEEAGALWIDYKSRKEMHEDSLGDVRRFITASYPSPGPVFSPQRVEEPEMDYKKLLLCHIQLYIVGDKYCIPDLTALTTHKLHRTFLASYNGYKLQEDIADATRYAYANTVKGDKPRTLLSHNIASGFNGFKVFIRHPAIRGLLEESGERAIDVAIHLAKDIDELYEECSKKIRK
ncbi:hypothetical protein DL766_005142 [Monosporascus sp. MC13-8B]|uniref:BTB domain-containing protein n=1 Tax=Monosporascus cannonballus TaxID=155416 RepID=A0ABY0HFY7_9PEZI|nr:hypothetical protein DL762_003010 [Monosporascus cannonballus]RYO96090.1 hypothetical protein DL763_003380 [Monosporascus cannonballus]RYP29943.1 hypothetical protein DL766_005142 [Monosporascus sp. MC13-8B]